ncbi:MAG: hypothetical protein ACI867_001667 [Glaciecola sp.]|jgi:hypothetical protein
MTTSVNVDLHESRGQGDRLLRVDVRGPRFGARVTMLVLGAAIVVQGPLGVVLVSYAVAQFAAATIWGVAASPNARLFRFARDRFGWGPATATESAAPPRFAQLCGLVVAGPGLVALMLGASTLGWVLVAIVLALSSVLALTGLCVGCELYIVGARLRARRG